jgi:hypothetical protein
MAASPFIRNIATLTRIFCKIEPTNNSFRKIHSPHPATLFSHPRNSPENLSDRHLNYFFSRRISHLQSKSPARRTPPLALFVQKGCTRVDKNTGPNTAEGKAISSQNARTHGMTSTLLLINGETQADLDHHIAQWHQQNPTTNEIAERLVVRAALSEWNLLRVERQYNTASSQLLAKSLTDWSDTDHALFKNIQRYLTTAQRTHHRDRLNLKQDRAEIRAEESHEKRMETAKASEDPPKFTSAELTIPTPPYDFPLNQDVILWRGDQGESRASFVPDNKLMLANIDDSLETTPVHRRYTRQAGVVVPGYEWVIDLLEKAPPDRPVVIFSYTAKSFRLILERENGGPPQPWPDLTAIDIPILNSKVKGPPCQPK